MQFSKDEILKKKGKSPEQLDLVKDLDQDKEKNKKRLLLLLILFLTVGLSIGLSLYRQYREGVLIFSFSIPKFPGVTLTSPVDKNVWQICLFNRENESIVYSKDCQMSEMPNSMITNNIDLIKSSLPNGLIINEQISSSSSEINYLSDISSPKFQYLLSIKIFGSFPLEISQNLIPKLASDLYWQYSKN